ncbi:MAG: GreA/GreB family elongation factor [Steroidobacteraceae bacterium]
MSRAFVKEQDGGEVDQDLPELVVSPHRNLVTPEGLAQIDAEVVKLREALSAARAAEDGPAIARCSRDLRYWAQRRSSAEVVPPPADATTVRFGSSVVLQPADGPPTTFRIVGEDEAAPADGRISYVSPLARSLLGQRVGDEVELAGRSAELVAIS